MLDMRNRGVEQGSLFQRVQGRTHTRTTRANGRFWNIAHLLGICRCKKKQGPIPIPFAFGPLQTSRSFERENGYFEIGPGTTVTVCSVKLGSEAHGMLHSIR